jgi:hypothetical protein
VSPAQKRVRGHLRHVASLLVILAAITSSGHSTAGDRELTESADFRVRVQAALRLGRTGGASSRADLEAGLRDAHPAVRVACAVALGQMGDAAAAPALQQAMRSESFPSAKSSMKEAHEKLRANAAGAGGGAADPRAGVEKAQYVVQLGTMRNNTGQRADLDNVMRSAARVKAGSIRNAVILDNPDAAILRRAGERKIPVLLVDGNLSRLSQTTGKDGGLIVSAQVDLSIIRVPGQTLKGTVSGKASASDDARNTNKGITELQNRAVNGAIESAMSSMGSEIAALAR